MLVVLQPIGAFVANLFKSRRRFEDEGAAKDAGGGQSRPRNPADIASRY